METCLTALVTGSLGSLILACASATAPPVHYSQVPAIQVDYPEVVMPFIEGKAGVISEPPIPLTIPDAPAAFMCGGLIIPEAAPVPASGTTWRVRSISDTQAELYGDVEQPTAIFHLEAASP
jgi:hypothetical protein